MDSFVVIALVVTIYFLPSIVAVGRHVPNTGSVFVINAFLGWTLIGWVVALAMAARSVPPGATRSVQSSEEWQAEQQQLLAEIDKRPRRA